MPLTFRRLNPPGTPPSEIVHPKPSDLGTGLRAAIIDGAVSSGFYSPRLDNDFSDSELLVYTCHAGHRDWFDWLLNNSDFYNSRKNIKKEYRSDLGRALELSVNGGQIEMARHLFSLGAKMGASIHFALYRAIRMGSHEMAELLFRQGGEIKPDTRLRECIHYADDRMKAIIRKGMTESVNRRFRK